MISIDVKTRGNIGQCLAIRVGAALGILKSIGVNIAESRLDVENDMLAAHGRRSQQKFLNIGSTDTVLRHPCRGIGGNTQTQRCILMPQQYVEDGLLEALRRGENLAHIIIITHVDNHAFTVTFI